MNPRVLLSRRRFVKTTWGAGAAVAVLLLNCIPSLFAQGLVVQDLRCEYCTNPLGLDTPKPRLSWILSSSRRAQRQTAYHILAASSLDALAGNRGELWDSGKVASGQSAQIEYEGTPFSSRARCFWKVLVWDKDGTPSDWSAPAQWEMGLFGARGLAGPVDSAAHPGTEV